MGNQCCKTGLAFTSAAASDQMSGSVDEEQPHQGKLMPPLGRARVRIPIETTDALKNADKSGSSTTLPTTSPRGWSNRIVDPC